MHQKQTIKQYPIFFLHIKCDDRLAFIAYSHGHAEISFESNSDLLHCLYFLIYPIFSSTWIQSSESTSRRLFHELFEKFGYKWAHDNNETKTKNDLQEKFINDALEEVKVEDDEPNVPLNPRAAMSEEEADILFLEAFLYPVEQNWSQRSDRNSPHDIELSSECLVSVNKLKEGMYELRTESGIFLEVSDVRSKGIIETDIKSSPELQEWETSQSSTLGEQSMIPQTSPASEFNSFTDDLDSDFGRQGSTTTFPGFNPNPTTFLGLRISKSLLQDASLRVIGQVDKKYILFTSNDQLLCLDQHAIHERILLEEMEEKLQKKMIQNSISTAQLDTRCQVSSVQVRVLKNQRYRQHLMSWGFHYSINKNSSLLISTTPVIEGENLTRLDFIEFVDYLFRNEDLPILTLKPPSVNRILSSKACRTAIKFGDPIPFQECEKLIQQLSKTSFPFQCAHGRPSIVPLFSFSKNS